MLPPWARPTKKQRCTNSAAIVDFYGDGAAIEKLFPGAKLTKATFTYQRSDHFPVWIQIKTDIDGDRLDQIVQNGKNERGGRDVSPKRPWPPSAVKVASTADQSRGGFGETRPTPNNNRPHHGFALAEGRRQHT